MRRDFLYIFYRKKSSGILNKNPTHFLSILPIDKSPGMWYNGRALTFLARVFSVKMYNAQFFRRIFV